MDLNGILLIDKPAGWTSHDVVAKVRNILKQRIISASHLDAVQGSEEERAKRTDGTESERQPSADTAMRQKPAGMSGFAGQQGKVMRRLKVGHTGTLDPFATGLLILVVGSYTKRAGEFSKLDKTYVATIILGKTSGTGDIEGEITVKSDEKPTPDEVKEVLSGFTGEIQQIPHKFSAIKVDGKRAYKLAREGKEVALEPRKVTIYSIDDIQYDYPKLSFTTKVSSGTYIRSLAEDIGEELGIGAYLSSLMRTRVHDFDLAEATSITEVDIDKIQKS